MYDLDATLTASPHLAFFAQREALFVYHDLFGYVLEMSPDVRSILDAFAQTPMTGQQALERLAEGFPPRVLDDHIETFTRHECLVPVDLDERELLPERVPVKPRWRVLYHAPEATLAVIGRSTRVPPRTIRLTGFARDLFAAIDGEHTLRELAHDLASDHDLSEADALARAVDLIAAWTHSEVQLTRVSAAPMSFFKGHIPRPAHIDSTMPFPRTEGDDAIPAPEGVIDLTRYHQQGVQDADRQFDEVETTLSHLFREPHPALGGQTYAGRLVEDLSARGWLTPDTRAVLEVGGGLGYFAHTFLDALERHHPDTYASLHYHILDLSPALHAAQQARLEDQPRFSASLGDGERLEGVEDGSLDLVISNEVIADMRTARLINHGLGSGPDDAFFDPEDFDEEAFDDDAPAYEHLEGPEEALEVLARYGVDMTEAPAGEVLVNLGAMRFLEAIWRGLKPGGHAILTEFGDRWRFPVESTHLDHAEVSIHFGQLAHVARGIGFAEVSVVDVPDLLELRGDAQALVASRTWLRNLQHLFQRFGVTLHKLAYTREQLVKLAGEALELDRVEALHFAPIGERTMGLEPRDFKALLLTRP